MKKSITAISILVLLCIAAMTLLADQETEKDKKWTYKIISDTHYHHYKRTVEVRLSDRISEAELTAIAKKIKSMDTSIYERTFITYYLPDMKVGHGAWATSHYDPELKVLILGSTKEQNVKMAAAAKKKKVERDVIGTWFYEAPYISQTIVLFRKGSKIFMEVTYNDGSSGIDEMIENKISKGTRYQEIGTGEGVDYFIINSEGNLEIWDDYGLVGTAKKL